MRRILLLLLAAPAWGQDALALRDAVLLALRENKLLAAAAAGLQASEERIAQARGGTLPKVNYSQSFTRSDNPVFVFSSLLTQHEFGAANFNIGPLNRPDFLNNFQSQVTVDQVLYDGGQTRNAIKSADGAHCLFCCQSKEESLMSVERYLRLIAGFFVTLSVALGYWVHPGWFLFTGFCGAESLSVGVHELVSDDDFSAKAGDRILRCCCEKRRVGSSRPTLKTYPTAASKDLEARMKVFFSICTADCG